MADIGQSPFLQALGWATLNSFWQWAALWFLFLSIQHLFRLTAQKKYLFALASISGGVVWFAITFFNHYHTGITDTSFLVHYSWAPGSFSWNIILASASITYLVLFIVPLYRFFKNWQYIKLLRIQGLRKADFEYRLFVKKVAALLGIKKDVRLYLSDLITSPVTIGYLKPIILLPVAALNNLSPKQTEAILLHELSHIRRYDYLVNMIITFVSTIFYFNPFIKKFISVIEEEREACCDEIVLQFEYDRFSYASALFLLEQNTKAIHTLTMAAAKKKYLLSRIKKIVGVQEKPYFSFNHFAGLFASLFLVLILNTIFIASKEKVKNETISLNPFENTFYAFTNNDPVAKKIKSKTRNPTASGSNWILKGRKFSKPFFYSSTEEPVFNIAPVPLEGNNHLIPVSYDASDEMVTEEQKTHISSTLAATKKVLSTSQWKEVEKSIADGMTQDEKEFAKEEYLNELEKVNWDGLESNLKAKYDKIDWVKIDANLSNALASIKLDSIQHSYSKVLAQIVKAEANVKNCIVELPMPDVSVKQLIKTKEQLRSVIDTIKIMRTKKIVRI
jgi:beta-lactamase regulating signal transducer with metallopeptidase domain